MLNNFLENIAPFLSKTTAIMSAVIILIFVMAFLVSTEKQINRQTVEKTIKMLKSVIMWLILLEVFLSFSEVVKFAAQIYFKG